MTLISFDENIQFLHCTSSLVLYGHCCDRHCVNKKKQENAGNEIVVGKNIEKKENETNEIRSRRFRSKNKRRRDGPDSQRFRMDTSKRFNSQNDKKTKNN